ncbi:MAG: type II secretion system F family protein [Acidobacteria bacterium]|nr:type II secretion system F family protein [Acidobacteriota bacterium]
MAIVVIGIAFVVGAAVVVGIALMMSRVPGMMVQQKVDDRLKEIALGDRFETEQADQNNLLKTQNSGPLPGLDAAIGGTARGSAIKAWIEQSGTKASLSAVLLVACLVGAAGALGGFMLTRLAAAAPAGFLGGFGLPFVVLRIKRTRRMRAFEEQFPEALDLISRALKAGHAFATGLKMAAEELQEPVGPEFRKTFEEQNYGLAVKDALDNLTGRIPLLDVRFFATAVVIQRETGGNLSEILENLAHVVRERFKILRQVRVYTAHGRLTGYVLLALPAVLAGALAVINPEHMDLLFRERMGQIMLLICLGMQTAGFLWIRQIVKIEV